MSNQSNRPTPPEETNYNHPEPAGARTNVPGEGVVSPQTSARAKTAEPNAPARQAAPRDRQAPDTPTDPADNPGSTGSAGPAARETNDPNFTAATGRRDERRPDNH